MRMSVAVDAEIAGRAHDAIAEVMLPETIHHHARGQRIHRGGNPFGERQPTSRTSTDKWNLGWFIVAHYGLKKSRRDRFAPARQIAARKDVSGREIRNLRRHHV